MAVTRTFSEICSYRLTLVYSKIGMNDTEKSSIRKQSISCDNDALIEFKSDDSAACNDGTGDVADGSIFRLHVSDHSNIF